MSSTSGYIGEGASGLALATLLGVVITELGFKRRTAFAKDIRRLFPLEFGVLSRDGRWLEVTFTSEYKTGKVDMDQLLGDSLLALE